VGAKGYFVTAVKIRRSDFNEARMCPEARGRVLRALVQVPFEHLQATAELALASGAITETDFLMIAQASRYAGRVRRYIMLELTEL
jgi:hypothetical protein